MNKYALSHLSDDTLLSDLAVLVARDRATTARLLAHLAEVDHRKLYLPAAYPSMYAWCVGELGLCEQTAYKRIQAARAARRFPAIYDAVAEGRLHLSAVVLLAAHLTEDNAAELLATATHRTKAGIEQMLAERFPRPDLPTRLIGLAPRLGECVSVPAPGPLENETRPSPVAIACEPASGSMDRASRPAGDETRPEPENMTHQLSPGIVVGTPDRDRARVLPLSPQRFGVQFTLGQTGHDKLRRAQDLLGHRVAPGDLGQVFERALDALIERLERQKLAATSQPRPGRGKSGRETRRIPAHVRRAVWARDGGRCTFESETGRRCEARRGLEFDHVLEYARGGEADVSGVRLRCRAHNQYTAGITFGSEFMRHKRTAAAETRGGVPAGSSAAEWARCPGPAGAS